MDIIPTKKINIVRVFNPLRFDRDTVTTNVGYLDNLYLIRQKYFIDEACVSLNGQVVREEELALTIPAEDDYITFIPLIYGGGNREGKTVIAELAMIALAVAAPQLSMYMLGVKTMTMGAVFLSTMIMTGGALLINVLLPPPEAPDKAGGSSYSWQPVTRQTQGLPIPMIFGEFKCRGNIINSYTEIIKNKQYLYCLISLGLGVVEDISDFKINDIEIDVTDPDSPAKIEVRKGYLNQTLIEGFDITKVDYSINTELLCNQEYNYTTVGSSWDSVEIILYFPLGLYMIESDGDREGQRVMFEMYARKHGTSDWYPVSPSITESVTIHQATANKYSAGMYVTLILKKSVGTITSYIVEKYWYSFEMYDTQPSGFYEGKPYDGYPLAYWTKLTSKTKYILSSEYGVENIKGIVYIYDKRSSEMYYSEKFNCFSGKGQYDIKIKRITEDTDNVRKIFTKSMLVKITECYNVGFTYPRNVLVGIKSLASKKLSGTFSFSCIVKGSLVRVYENSQWVVKYSNNPAWVALHILTQPVFDNNLNVVRYDGMSPNNIDLTKLVEWAEFCDELVPNGKGGQEKRCTFNGIFDEDENLWDAVMKVCQVGRCIPVYNGSMLTFAIDKQSSVTQRFTVGNIIKDSFKEMFMGVNDRINELEIDYIDKDLGYEKTTITVVNDNINDYSNKAMVTLRGVTSASEAWRYAMYRLNCNQYLKRTIEFQADVDAIACTLGDVIEVQYDIPQQNGIPDWGYGGRIVSAGATTVTLDRKVYIDISKSYKIIIRLSDDTFVEKSIVNPSQSGEYDTVTVSTSFTTIPQQYDMYAFGEVNKVMKKFRITDISLTQEQKATISAIEYYDEIYGSDTQPPQIPDYQISPVELLPATNTYAEEVLYIDESGNVVRKIMVRFQNPNPVFQRIIVMYWSMRDPHWIDCDKVGDDYAIIESPYPSTTYRIVFITIGNDGNTLNWSQCPIVEITTTDQYGIIDWFLNLQVSGLQIFGKGNDTTFEGKDCKFVWNDISSTQIDVADDNSANPQSPNTWFRDYEVKILDSSGNLLRTYYTPSPEYTYTYEYNYVDNNGSPTRGFTIEVRARDKFGRLSQKASLTVNNAPPPVPDGISVTAYYNAFEVKYYPVDVPDLVGYMIHASTTPNFEPSSSNLIADTPQTSLLVTGVSGTWYVKLAAYDTFDKTGLLYSNQYQVTTLDVSTPDTTPPNTPTGLSLQTGIGKNNDGSDFAYIYATWNANTEPDLAYYEYRCKESGGNYMYGTTGTNSMIIKPLRSNIVHYVGVRAVDTSGNKSSWTSDLSITTSADTTPPSPVINLTATAAFKTIFLSWTMPADKDINYVEIFRSNDSNRANAVSIAKVKTSFYADNIGVYGVTRYYWVKVWDTSDNASSEAGYVSATTANIKNADIDDFAITASKIWTKIPIVTGDSWSDNSPSSGYVSWNAHTLYYNGTAYNIASGNTNNKYIYWVYPNNSYSSSNTNPTLDDNSFIIATNINGYHDLAWNAIANQVIGSAYIQDLAVNNAKIIDLSAEKITAGDIAVDRLIANSANAVNLGAVAINAQKILISGSTYLSDWRYGGDATKIDGGDIATNTITANKIVIGSRNLSIQGIEISANYPNTNTLYWTSGVITYIDDNGVPQNVNISSGSQAWSSGTLYLYWGKGNGYLSVTTDASQAFTSNTVVLATYRGGTDLVVNYGRTIIDGDDIVTNTITGNKIKAGEIVGTHIQTQTIEGLHCKFESIETSKLILNPRGFNLISDPGFELGNLSKEWTTEWTSKITLTTSNKHSGGYAITATTSSGETLNITQRGASGTNARRFYLKADSNTQYTEKIIVGAWVYRSNNQVKPQVGVNVYDASGNAVDYIWTSGDVTTGAWVYQEYSKAVPSSARYCEFLVSFNSSGLSGGTAYIDDVFLFFQANSSAISDLTCDKLTAGVLRITDGTSCRSSFGGDINGNRDGLAYFYDTSGNQIAAIGYSSQGGYAYVIAVTGDNANRDGMYVRGKSMGLTAENTNTSQTWTTAIQGYNPSTQDYCAGVTGVGGKFGGRFSGKCPLLLIPDSGSTPPSDVTSVGALWVDNSGILWIYTTTGWVKVGTQS